MKNQKVFQVENEVGHEERKNVGRGLMLGHFRSEGGHFFRFENEREIFSEGGGSCGSN